ncbi:protein kinase, putative [Leishmania tarentolae]|uniref:Protein kinase, putative n=1 Tax=Leishmania tarentolae TaxID=5689 RepID=A0A640KIT4_LEITA|nr:protein kinase, putative [Leishmania tarentolae]
MDSATASAERAASSALSASLPLKTRSSTTSTATLTPALEGLRQAKSSFANGYTALSTISSAKLSLGHTELSPGLLLDSHLLAGHDDNIGAVHTTCVRETHRHGTDSTQNCCRSVYSSKTSEATRSRGVSSSSGGLTRMSAGGAATCLSSTSACVFQSEVSVENERSLASRCFSSPSGGDSRIASSSSRARCTSGSPPTSSSTAHSPDAHPPTPAASPLASPSERIQQCHLPKEKEGAAQEQEQRQPMHFSVPIMTRKTSTSPPAHPPTASLPADLSSSMTATDQTAMALLQDLSYAEVQEAQEWLAGAGRAKPTWAGSPSIPLLWSAETIAADLGVGENGSTAAALLETSPASLDAVANLRFSQFFCASLMEEGSGDTVVSDGERGTLHRGAGKRVNTREAVEMARADAVRRSTGATHSWGEAASRSCEYGGAFQLPWPDVVHEFDVSGTSMKVKRGAEDHLTDSPIWGVPTSSTHLHRIRADVDGRAPTSLSYAFAFPSPSAPEASANCNLAWPAAPLPAERNSRASAPHSLSSGTAARRWSLSDFDIAHRIGSGRSSKTFLAREKRSKVVVALKVVHHDYAQRSGGGTNRLERAMRLQSAAGRRCPHIVKLYAFFTDARHCYAALEYATAGDLASHLLRQPHQRLSEAQAQVIIYHLVLALRDLHEKSVVHRAVTLHNVLLYHSGEGTIAKLGDFASAVQLVEGHARWIGELGGSHDGEPSLEYMAPEVIRGHGWSCKSDMWALGVLALEMICGHHPFDHVSASEMKRLICSGATRHSPYALSHTGMSFVRSLLCVDEAARSSAATALTHPFLSVGAVAPTASVASAMQEREAHGCLEPVGSAVSATTATTATVDGSRISAVAVPVSRDLSHTFTLAAVMPNTEAKCCRYEDERRPVDAIRAGTNATIGCAEAALDSLVLRDENLYAQPHENPPVNSFTMTVSSPNSTHFSTTQRVAGTRRRALRAAWNTTDTVAPVISLSSDGSPGLLMSFALPTDPWQNTALPASVSVSASSLFSALSREEEETSSGLQPSATTFMSAGNASHLSSTRTLSDMSASVLSATRAPTTLAPGAAATTGDMLTCGTAPESVLSVSFTSHDTYNYHHLHSQQYDTRRDQQHEQHKTPIVCAAVGTARPGERRRSEDTREDCSVTVSSSTPRPSFGASTEWTSEDEEVSVSSFTASSTSASSTGSTAPQTRFPTHTREAYPHQLTSHIALSTSANAALQAKRLPLTSLRDSSTITVTSARAVSGVPSIAVTSSHARRPKPGRRKLSKMPECSLRLAFETLSDDDSW